MIDDTHGIPEVAASLDCSERWLVEQIRSGRFPARKIGRTWRMTDSDVAAALDACLNDAPRVAHVIDIATGLTPRSRRRVVGQ